MIWSRYRSIKSVRVRQAKLAGFGVLLQGLQRPTDRIEGPDWRRQEQTGDGKAGTSVQGSAVHVGGDPVGGYLQFPISYRDLELMLWDRACRSTTRPSTAGSRPTPWNWRSGCGPTCARPTARGGSMRPTSRSKGAGSTCIGRSTAAPDHRFPAQRQARCPGRQALFQESSGPVEHGQSADYHGRQERRLSQGGGRDEEGQEALALLQAAPGQVSQQHCATRSPGHKRTPSADARLQEFRCRSSLLPGLE